MAIAENPDDVWRLTIKGNSVAVVTDGSAVLGLGNIGPGAAHAGDGGQGGAVQAVRRHRRLADLPGHPGHRRDRPGGRDDRPRLRRHQPRGHRGARAASRSSAGCASARHPRLPRRPARHRDRGAGGAHQRAAGGEARTWPTSASWCPAAAPPAPRSSRCCSPRASRDVVVVDRDGALSADDDDACPRPTASSPRPPTRAGARGDLHDRARRCRRVHRRQRPGHAQGRVDPGHGRRRRWSSRSPTPTRRSTPPRPTSTPRWWPAGRSDYPNQINNVLAFPGVFRGLLDARAHEITIDMLLRAAEAIALRGQGRGAEPDFIIPSVFHPDVTEGGRGRRPRRRVLTLPLARAGGGSDTVSGHESVDRSPPARRSPGGR